MAEKYLATLCDRPRKVAQSGNTAERPQFEHQRKSMKPNPLN